LNAWLVIVLPRKMARISALSSRPTTYATSIDWPIQPLVGRALSRRSPPTRLIANLVPEALDAAERYEPVVTLQGALDASP